MSIRVLVADDNSAARSLLSQIIGNAPDMQVIGLATNGLQAVQMTKALDPNVVVMDALIPHMDAIEAIREIMDLTPIPIVVVCTAAASREANIALEAIKAGALAVLQKPGQTNLLDYGLVVKELVSSVRAMAGVHVIRHARAGHLTASNRGSLPTPSSVGTKRKLEIISIVASTGGPQTLSEIIKDLPTTFSLPIIIVQHITPDFVTPLVNWLGTISQLPVRIACSGEVPERGTIYFAPGRAHLRMTHDRRFELSDTPHNVAHIPSGDVLLESVARNYGSGALGIVLTGMGNDGAHGLRAMYDVGAMTVAQEANSCVVFGMPQEAIAIGAAQQTLTPSQISNLLLQYVS